MPIVMASFLDIKKQSILTLIPKDGKDQTSLLNWQQIRDYKHTCIHSTTHTLTHIISQGKNLRNNKWL